MQLSSPQLIDTLIFVGHHLAEKCAGHSKVVRFDKLLKVFSSAILLISVGATLSHQNESKVLDPRGLHAA